MDSVRKQEALNEWLVMDDENMRFHMRQFEEPYRSTVHFTDFIKRNADCDIKTLIDIGCGAGSALDYIVNQNAIFKNGVGIDINEELVVIGNNALKMKNNNSCKLYAADIFGDVKIPKLGGRAAAIALQVFDILPDYRPFVKAVDRLNPVWFAASTLGFEGDIDYLIKLKDYTKDKDGEYSEVFYNIYSLPKMEEFFENLGYRNFVYSKFEMDIDLPMTNPKGRGTYTVKTEEGKRIQISGGMMMPWYFIYAEKK